MSIGAALDFVLATQAEIAKYTSAPYAIAGGCLRDAFFGKPIKDVDVIVYSAEQWEPITEWPDVNDYGPTGEFMAGETEIKVLGKYPVQPIWRNGEVSAEGMIKCHSLAISNFFFIDGTFVIDPQALIDYRDKMHTLNRTRWAVDEHGEERLQKYVRKIQEKYPWEVRPE